MRKKYFHGKSQAAMEFMLTYGWAIVVVLVLITGLAYFGVLDVDRWFPPNQCVLPVGMSCIDYTIQYKKAAGFDPATNTVELYVKNNRGNKIEITNAKVMGSGIKGATDPVTYNNEGVTIEIKNIQIDGKAISLGDKFELDFMIEYTNQETGLTHKEQGFLKGIVTQETS